MFAIFVLSLLSLALFPYTIYRFCNSGDAEEVVKPWQVRDFSLMGRECASVPIRAFCVSSNHLILHDQPSAGQQQDEHVAHSEAQYLLARASRYTLTCLACLIGCVSSLSMR